ncbi:MAG: TerB family tellurite resistance protein [Ekhidna sp.]|nr:TerB family tellurite resistance protein [Ekhidna sp.]
MKRLEKFRMMIRLALVDNLYEASEQEFIQEYAKIHNVNSEELETIVQEELQNKGNHEPISLQTDFEGKIEILTDLVRVMKADGQVFLSEIRFCEMIANMFGFDSKSIGFLSKIIYNDKDVQPNWSRIESQMRNYVA